MRLTIETPRLVLRPPEDRDAEAIARGVGDFDVARMTALVPYPYTVEVGQGWILCTRMQRRRAMAYNFLMDSRADGVVGCMGVFRRRPESDWEVGYWVAKPFWGRGYATEALTGIIAWTRAELRPARLLAGHFEDNPASRRVLEKAGFRPTGEAQLAYSMARDASARCIDMALDLDPAARAA